jgi:hypothetical protein
MLMDTDFLCKKGELSGYPKFPDKPGTVIAAEYVAEELNF